MGGMANMPTTYSHAAIPTMSSNPSLTYEKRLSQDAQAVLTEMNNELRQKRRSQSRDINLSKEHHSITR